MEEALPPGCVPSASRENISTLIGADAKNEDGKATLNLKDGSFSSGRDKQMSKNPESSSSPPSCTLQAWGFPDEDLKQEEPPSQLPASKANLSPFIATPDSRTGGGGDATLQRTTVTTTTTTTAALSNGEHQTTPKRVLSPLKRHNKIAPSPGQPSPSGKGTLLQQHQQQLASSEENSTLKSSSTPLLIQSSIANSSSSAGERERPDSAPMKKEKSQRHSREPPPVEARVIVVSSNGKGKEEPEKRADSPVYSTVVKTTPPAAAAAAAVQALKDSKSPSGGGGPRGKGQPSGAGSSGSIITVRPTLEEYEPEPSLDTSVVISNISTASTGASPPLPSPPPQNISQVLENDYTATPDPLYSTIEEVDTPAAAATSVSEVEMATYNPALVKQLKKHDDKGTVQLVSIKGNGSGLATGSGAAVCFPQGSSADMHALHYAAGNGSSKALAELISALPVSQDSIEMVLGSERLVKRLGIDVLDSEGRTPLMHAVHNEQEQAAKMLVEAGANVNKAAADGSTALHQAAYAGSVKMVALLLSMGANGLLRDSEERTPLHWCTNNSNSKCTELLLDKVTGLEINIRDGALMTPLMWAAFHSRTEQVRVLMERGADPSIGDMDGMTAVHWSVQKHNTAVLQMLINSESADYSDNKGKTVMHQAAEQGSAKAVSLIKAVKPTSVNDLDDNGRTPLHWATACENPEVIRALLHHGADISIRDNSGKTALEYALEKGLHYCALILTKADGVDSTDSYHSILMYGSAPATLGARTLQHQEGQFTPENIRDMLSSEQILQIQTVCNGSWIYKFTNNGKGPLHPRYFWINPSNTKLCWAKARDPTSKNTKSDILVGTRSSASPAIFGRKDFDPIDKHKYSFTIFTRNRVLDTVAVSSEDYKLWLNGLQLVLQLGSVNVTRLMSVIQEASGITAMPIT